MATFILIHGGGHGGWCWERVVPLLEAEGHRALAPDLPGMGDDKTPLTSITPELWARFVVDLIEQQSEPVVLVGHSRGGMEISEAAECAPERIARLVYVSAVVPVDGKSMQELMMTLHDERPGMLEISADGVQLIVNPAFARPVFLNTTDEAWVQRAISKLTPEPMIALTTPTHLSHARWGRVPKTFIELLEDQAIPIARQRELQKNAKFDAVLQLPTDHSPFYSAPDKLAAALIAAAA